MHGIRRIVFNFFNLHLTSGISRVRLFKLFGAYVGAGSKIEAVRILNYDGTNLSNLWIGERVYVGANCILDLKDKIIIGESTKIAAGCNLSTHVDCGEENPIYGLYPRRKEPISIGRHCWIGLNVTMLCGTTIGDNTIIGALSLVNKNVPPNVIAHGSPVKIKQSLELNPKFESKQAYNLKVNNDNPTVINKRLKDKFVGFIYPAHKQ